MINSDGFPIVSINRTFEEMATRANERIETTAELVDLTNYMNTCMSDTFFKLKTGIRESMERLLFLMEYHIFEGKRVHLKFEFV